MKKLTLFLIPLLFITATAQPRTASACSCLPPGSPQESMESSVAVFAGRVSSVMPAPEYGNNVTFNVTQSWKGPTGADISVFTASDSAACGVNFETGKDYIVYASANEDDGTLRASLCSRTHKLMVNDEDLAALGVGAIPEPMPTEEMPVVEEKAPQEPQGVSEWWMALGALAVLGILSAAVVQMRKKH